MTDTCDFHDCYKDGTLYRELAEQSTYQNLTSYKIAMQEVVMDEEHLENCHIIADAVLSQAIINKDPLFLFSAVNITYQRLNTINAIVDKPGILILMDNTMTKKEMIKEENSRLGELAISFDKLLQDNTEFQSDQMHVLKP